MTLPLPQPPKVPCGTCPYRKDVPSGVWAAEEYLKLPDYDKDTPNQPFGLFMCHQRDGCLCGGWLMTHDREHLLALRFNKVDPRVWKYNPPVYVFASGKEACLHGLADITTPGKAADHKIKGLLKQQAKRIAAKKVITP